MKKNFLLTLLLALFSITTSWAQFEPTEGKRYALQETTSGLYLDIQTLGVNEANANATTNNISLNAKPCVIYFAKGTTDNTKWTMKNVNGTYAMQASSRNWNATIGTTAYEWLISEPEASIFTIARADNKFVSMDSPKSGSPLFCDKDAGLKFKLVDYDEFQQATFTMKSPLTGVTKGAIQSAAQLNAITTATKIVIQNVSTLNSNYLAANENVTEINNAVLIWEPVTEGASGTYYLKKLSEGDNGYIQNGTGAVTLGTKTNAQVFVTTVPATPNETFATGTDTGNLVRFVQNGASTWLNCTQNSTPILGNTGTGGYTVHNVYLVTDATYLNLTAVSTTAASMQATPTEFYIIPSADKYYFQNVANENQYIGYVSGENTWDVNTNFGVWQILADDNADGFAQIARGDDATKRLGSNEECVVGKGIFNNVGDACNGWFFNGVYDNYTTTATSNGGKYEFTSGKIYTAGPCNKIRFTLTESAAYYKNGTNRLSFDSFALYDINGEPVELYANNITGNNGKVFDAMLDGTSGTYTAGTWDNASATNDWFEIILGSDVDLKGGFSFYFQTENTTMNATEFKIELSYETPSDYTFVINNAPDGAVVTFDGNPIANDDKIAYAAFDEDLLVATDIQGYTWSVVVDKANLTITITYTEAPVVENPTAVVALINRIGGEGTDAKFKFVLDPSMNSKNEVFSINGEDGKILIKGTTLSAITTGIGWYLQNIAHINISWNALNEKTVSGDAYADLSSIPVPTAEEVHTSDAMYRYYLNTCAFGYSMTSWTWKRWQQEIDWMALHGINMPLQLVGLEEVWRSFLTMKDGDGNRKYGYTDEEAKAFVAGPAFIAWWAMNNLQGWGGTAPGTKSNYTNLAGAGGVQDDAWYTRQKKLANDIVTRQRELGMQPVIPGWSGMVPTNFASKSGYTTRGNGGNWAGDFVRPLLLSVSNANYAEIAADYYTCLHKVMGESQYYSMDPFHEGGGAGTMEDYEAMYAAMEAAKPGSQWVIQQWQWSSTQKYSLTAVPAGRLIVLDLFSDGSPAFDSYSGYAPQDAVFCAIPNFGGRSGIMARLTNLTDNYFKFKAKYSSIKGIGAAPEAIEQTPVTYDLIFQLPWMNGVKPDVAEWVSNYSIARYGVVNDEIQEAWSLLRQGPLNYGADGIQGPVEDVWAAKPNLTANKASSWGVTLANAQGTYTKARQQMLIDATYKLISQSSAIAPGTIYESNYKYDLVEFGGGVLADYAYYLLLGINEAKTASNTALYEARRDAFLQLILDVDAFKGTNLNFRLGKWTQEARDAAGEVEKATTATPDWYEYNNARTIVSTWSSPGTNLNDYSYRSWQGLMKDLYYPRWKYYFDNDCTEGNYDYFAWNWAHGMEHYVGQTEISSTPLTSTQDGHTSKYTREPEGNTLEKAKEVLGKYIIPVVSNTGTYYAYRCLTNDLSAICTVVAEAGQTIDLSTYFGELTNVSITGDFIDGTATDIKAVTVKADTTDGSHTGTITLTDGTVLTFAVVINPPYYGVYKIDYQNNGDIPVFVAYCTEYENGSSDGYKLIANGTYQPTVEADKLFTISPLGTGYSLSAQGLYMKAPDLSTWNHIAFSDNSSEAGAYLFEETGTDTEIFKIRSTGDGNNYLNDYNNLVFGNDASTKENLATFKVTEVTEYIVNVPAEGYTTLYLPFNVVLPEGVTAYSVMPSGIIAVVDSDDYEYRMVQVATAGETLFKGTPVIIKAAGGKDYTFGVTVNNTGAKKTVSSVLNGTYFTKNINSSEETKRYAVTVVDDKVVFDRIDTETEITANSCWMTLNKDCGDLIAEKAELIVPFTLTTDEENPVLYRIQVNRNYYSPTILQYSESKNIVNIAAEAANASYQAWYFMESANGFVIKPYNAMGKVLSASSNSNAKDAVTAQPAGKQTYYEWEIETLNDGWYAIRLADDSNYMSNNGGNISNSMGFYNSTTDGGSQFKFVPITFENDNPRYYQLKDVTAAMDVTKQAMSGDAPGCREGGDAHFDAYTAATGFINEGNTADAAECYTAYTTLRATQAALGEIKQPVPGTVYRIKNYIALSVDEYKYHYIANNNEAIGLPTTSDDNTTLWLCVAGEDSTYKFVSAMGSAALAWKQTGNEAQPFTIKAGIERGAVALAGGATSLMSLTNELNSNKLNLAQAGAIEQGADWSTDWYLEPVTDANVYYRRTIGNGYRWATLYLPFAVEVPDGVTAYYATAAPQDNVITLTEVGDTIPAHTPVLLGRPEESKNTRTDYDFYLTKDVEAIDGNIFIGKVKTTYIECQSGYKYYLLLNATKGEAFYWIAAEYNATGGSSDTHIKCEANKVYMELASQAGSSYYRFELEDGSTTGIEDLNGETAKPSTIYDLQGRKVEKPGKGLYIIDGKKTLVK